MRRRAQRAERARGREAEGGSVCPEPTLNRRSMGHTLEENGKWGSWRGWPGKDRIPPYALTLLPSFILSLTGMLSFSHLAPSSSSRTRCSPAASSALFHLLALLLILLHHSPPSTDILFRSLTLLSPWASRLTLPSRVKVPGCPRPPVSLLRISRSPPSTRQ